MGLLGKAIEKGIEGPALVWGKRVTVFRRLIVGRYGPLIGP
jgi:hypothetical protein